mmetsp:Transcript_11929/g.35210  ORF Transcript_11929/g.35210 Transcript_11929/m.35210 type:complete len:200 (+) Transcript_11929:728-1327(+)
MARRLFNLRMPCDEFIWRLLTSSACLRNWRSVLVSWRRSHRIERLWTSLGSRVKLRDFVASIVLLFSRQKMNAPARDRRAHLAHTPPSTSRFVLASPSASRNSSSAVCLRDRSLRCASSMAASRSSRASRTRCVAALTASLTSSRTARISAAASAAALAAAASRASNCRRRAPPSQARRHVVRERLSASARPRAFRCKP